VRYDTTLGDDNVPKEFAQLFVVSDGELQVSGHDTVLLVIACGIACKFEDLSSEVFEDGGEVHWCTSTHTLCVVTLLQPHTIARTTYSYLSLSSNQQCLAKLAANPRAAKLQVVKASRNRALPKPVSSSPSVVSTVC